MIYKTNFSILEANEIRLILQKLISAQTSEKKKLRAVLRNKFDFHISFFDNSNSGFDSDKFDAFIKSGVIKIHDKISIDDTTILTSTIGVKRKDLSILKEKKRIEKGSGVGKNHKLQPIAELIISYLESTFKTKTSYTLEYKPKWLTCVPSKNSLEQFGKNIKEAYFELTDRKLYLIERLKLVNKEGQQSFDIWINEPFNFAVEFDESQHFNQFRLSSLNFYENISTGFDILFYKELSDRFIRPSTSGFTKLKKPTLLFPEFLAGPDQDNRIRQRAFRDLLKDLVPKSMGFNNTIRIPYYVTSKKTDNFDDSDLANISNYLKEYRLLSKLTFNPPT